jgi:hypothetical protein
MYPQNFAFAYAFPLGLNSLPHHWHFGSGLRLCGRGFRRLTSRQAGQNLFRVTCVELSHWNGCEQFAQVFHHGYTRFWFKCFGGSPYIASALFNEATVSSGDELVCVI